MIKLVASCDKETMACRGGFRDYWLETHAPLAAAIPGLRGYRINIAGDAGEQPPAPYDGSASCGSTITPR